MSFGDKWERISWEWKTIIHPIISHIILDTFLIKIYHPSMPHMTDDNLKSTIYLAVNFIFLKKSVF